MDDLLQGVVAAAQEGRSRLVEQRTELAARLADLDADIRRFDKVLRAAGVEEKKPQSKKQKIKTVSEELLDQVRQLFEQQPEHTFIVRELAEQVGKSPSSVQAAVNHLRDHEEVRLAGTVEAEGPGMAPRGYKLMRNGAEAATA